MLNASVRHPRGESGQLSDVLCQLYQFVVLADYASDDSPLLGTSDCAVTESCSAADNAVVADDVLLWLDNDRTLVPYEWFFKYFEDLLVDHRCLDTRDLPLVLSHQKRCDWILYTHDEVEELFK